MDIYLLSYNNYYNRQYKREENLSAYLSYVVYQVAGVNTWANGDGVDNSWRTGIIDSDISAADYLLTCSGADILGRWFIVEKNEISKNRYVLTLRRDLLGESLPIIENDAFFAERCILPDTSPYIYNAEDFRVNRIKRKETPIKDKTGVPWIIGYFNKQIESKPISGSLDIQADITVDSLQNWAFYEYIANPFNCFCPDNAVDLTLYWANVSYSSAAVPSWRIYEKYTYKRKAEGSTGTQEVFSIPEWSFNSNFANGYLYDGKACPTIQEVLSALPQSTCAPAIRTALNVRTDAETKSFYALDGAVIHETSNNKYYKVNIISSGKQLTETINNRETSRDGVSVINSICTTKLQGLLDVGIETQRNLFTMRANVTQSYISLTDITASVAKFSFSIPTGHRDTEDAPYDILAIPYGAFNNTGNAKLAMSAINALIATYNVGASSPVFDVQLLPFCPLFETVLPKLKANVDYVQIEDADKKVLGNVYFSPRATFSLSLPLKTPVSVQNPKIENICDIYRLVSPNFNGQFEFTAAKNGGLSVINVDATYIPFNPFIRIAPAFGGLYGEEFKDARGLICGGDFSLPIITSAWVSYQQNNKQYQNIFDRQIKNIEFTQEQQRIQERWNAATGVVSGGMQGAQMGAAAGPWGAVAGSAIGAGASLVGAGLDQYYNELARREAIGYSKDVHRLNLQSIEAQPDSLARTTAFNAINKVFPILEYFTCTDEEKNAVAKSIIENSMRAGFVTTISEIAQNRWNYGELEDRGYISGKLIRSSVKEDPHYLTALNDELLTGFYRR